MQHYPARCDALLPSARASVSDRVLQSSILVVEDNALSQKLMLETLRKHGFTSVDGASGGYEALEKTAASEPDLIILDLMMPNMDGFALCQEFRKNPKLQNVPILVHTALENDRILLSIFSLGASDLVRKPVNEGEFIARCRIHLEKRHTLKDLQNYQLRVEDDLANARSMQNLLMPDSARIAKMEYDYGMDIRAHFAPSFVIGGDFWGMQPLSAGKRFAFYIGDFTGHGVSAAVNVFRLCTLIEKLEAGTLASPADCMSQLNAQLHAMLPIELFATMFYGVMDTANNRLHYCIAGCPPPLMLRKGTGFHVLEGSGLPLAAVRGTQYREHRIDFRAGDALLLYSDALIETPDAEGRNLEIQEIGTLLSGIPQAQRHAERLLQTTIGKLEKHAPFGVEDDLTLNVYMRNR